MLLVVGRILCWSSSLTGGLLWIMQRGTRGVAALWSQATYFLLRSSQFETFLIFNIFRIYHGQAVWLRRLMMTKMTATTKMITTMTILCLWQYNWRGWLPPTATVTPVKVNTSQRRLPTFCFYTSVWFPFPPIPCLFTHTHTSEILLQIAFASAKKLKGQRISKTAAHFLLLKQVVISFVLFVCLSDVHYLYQWNAMESDCLRWSFVFDTPHTFHQNFHLAFASAKIVFETLILGPRMSVSKTKIHWKLVQQRLQTILHIRWYNRAWRPHDKNLTLFTRFLPSK